jgi:hypothetical protein
VLIITCPVPLRCGPFSHHTLWFLRLNLLALQKNLFPPSPSISHILSLTKDHSSSTVLPSFVSIIALRGKVVFYCLIDFNWTLQKNLLQLPPVDMQLLWFYFCCYLDVTQITLQTNFNAQSLCIVHSDCARRVFLDWLGSKRGSKMGLACMSTGGGWSRFSCSGSYASLST